ncbi:hypothetical protein MMG00_01255 [Ignatzschineria rhizosphaerae]|uniref:Uncharacterized protein n=1 Tax=Ignatzschineria rhizosphaerae TaxID=2923279 RepID=A0ABY3X0W9_9GAMM|nr:hypothetical protein [Ignatzschineria rhizosphaerae]UNM96522.1 hypothetical protein MMG00_01255 [Ignatzschineria rhizosphaerae]
MARDEFKNPLDLFSDDAYYFLFTHLSIKEDAILMLETALFDPSFLMMGIRGRATGIFEDPFLALPSMRLMSIEEEDYLPFFWTNIANEIEGS